MVGLDGTQSQSLFVGWMSVLVLFCFSEYKRIFVKCISGACQSLCVFIQDKINKIVTLYELIWNKQHKNVLGLCKIVTTLYPKLAETVGLILEACFKHIFFWRPPLATIATLGFCLEYVWLRIQMLKSETYYFSGECLLFQFHWCLHLIHLHSILFKKKK